MIAVYNFCDFYDRTWKEMNLKSVKAANQLIEADNSLEMLDYTSSPLHEVAYALFATPRPTWRARRSQASLRC